MSTAVETFRTIKATQRGSVRNETNDAFPQDSHKPRPDRQIPQRTGKLAVDQLWHPSFPSQHLIFKPPRKYYASNDRDSRLRSQVNSPQNNKKK